MQSVGFDTLKMFDQLSIQKAILWTKHWHADSNIWAVVLGMLKILVNLLALCNMFLVEPYISITCMHITHCPPKGSVPWKFNVTFMVYVHKIRRKLFIFVPRRDTVICFMLFFPKENTYTAEKKSVGTNKSTVCRQKKDLEFIQCLLQSLHIPININ